MAVFALPANEARRTLGPARERRRTPRLDVAGRSDKGRLRERNEDQFLIAELGRWMQLVETSIGTPGDETMSLQGTLLVVADGIGADSGGDIASAIALESFVQHAIVQMPWIGRDSTEADGVFRADVESFVAMLGAQLAQVASERRVPRVLGTTLTVGYVHGNRLILAHVGDSRAYVVRQGALSLLTHDHAREVVAGMATARDATRVAPASTSPDLASVELEAGDRLVLCTDGLYASLSDDRITELVASAASAEAATKILVDEAVRFGGLDSVTVVTAFA